MELGDKVKVINKQSFWYGFTGKIVGKLPFNNFLVRFVYRPDSPLSPGDLLTFRDSQLEKAGGGNCP